MTDSFTRDKFRRPELLFREILRKGAQGMYVERGEHVPFLHRALVIAVDVKGGNLENPNAEGSVSHKVNGKSYTVDARTGPKNPKNSIKARILSDGLDKFSTDENLRIFWPFFPESISIPIKPGEHVYVLFEDAQQTHGLWVTKVPGHSGVNYAPGEKFYEPVDSGKMANKFPDTSIDDGQKKFDKNEDAAETKPGNKLSSLFG